MGQLVTVILLSQVLWGYWGVCDVTQIQSKYIFTCILFVRNVDLNSVETWQPLENINILSDDV